MDGVIALKMVGMLRLRGGKRARRLIGSSYLVPGLLLCGLATGNPAHAQIIETAYVDGYLGKLEPSGWSTQPETAMLPSQEMPAYAAIAPETGAEWAVANGGSELPSPPEAISGPPQPESLQVTNSDKRFASFGSQVGAVRWEVAGIAAYITASQIAVTKSTRSFHFQDEGWFGKSTKNLGVDKLTHAFNSYVLTELLQARISQKTDNARGSALTAAILASGLMAYSELYDAHKESSGFSIQDVVFNTGGAAFSVLRNTIPGLKEKVDFRLLLMPNSEIYTFKGKEHYAQQRFLLAVQLSGFEKFKNSPLRFVELHAGYYAKGFTARDQERGEIPQRKLFFGLGLNLKELFFKTPRSTIGRVAGHVLDYIQLPYTAIHVD